jgi:hypothetical protein
VVRTALKRVMALATHEHHRHSVRLTVHDDQRHLRPIEAARQVFATVIHPDASVEHVLLNGDDSARFNAIKEYLGDVDVTAVAISDQDGPAAVGWKAIDGDRKGLAANEVASALVDGVVVGPMVITGPGRGVEESMTSIHEGFRIVVERMAREAGN